MARRRTSRRPAEPTNFWDSLFFRFGSKLLFAVAVIVVVLTLAQCTIKKPEAPTWETQLTVPLINRTYPMAELIRRADQDGIEMIGDTIQYSITYGLDTFRLDQSNLTTPDLTYNFSKQVGVIELTPPSSTPVTVAASSIPGLSAFIPGSVPPVSFTVTNAVPAIASFTSVSVSNGQVYGIVTNTLGIDLDTVRVIVIDVIAGAPIDTAWIIGGLPDGTSDSALIDLNGKTIFNQFQVDLACHTPGGTVLSSSGKEIVTAMRFASPFTANSAVAQVPSLSRTDSQQVTLNELDPISDAVISGGSLNVTISNNTALSADVQISMPQLLLSGVPLAITSPVMANATTPISINLTGYRLQPMGAGVPQAVAVIADLASPGSGVQTVSIDQSNSFSVDAMLSNLVFNSVTGVFANTAATFTPVVENIDVPLGFEGIHLSHVVLSLEITNGVNLPGQLDVTLDGNNGRTLQLQDAVAAATLSTAATTFIVDTGAAAFLDPIPSQITISGQAAFGDGITPGTIRSGDFVTGTVSLTAPLEMILDRTPVETDIERQEVKQDDIDKITDHVLEASFIYNVVSRLPIGATLNIYLGADSATLYTNPQLLIDSIQVPAAPTVGGIASDTISTGDQNVVLDSADIQILKNPILFVGQELVLEGSGGQVIRLTPSDAITLTGRIEVNYRFDGEF
ncbi:MAG: hypothetical protein AB1644_01670 [Candidatus Zixiibacteriota bacterium]